MRLYFNQKKAILEAEFQSISWIEESGLSEEALIERAHLLEKSGLPKATVKAETFRLLAENARIAIDRDNIFQDKLFYSCVMKDQRNAWEKEIVERFLKEEAAEIRTARKECGAYTADKDFGHTSPNSELLLRVGFTGLLERVNAASARKGLSEKQTVFYDSCRTVLLSMITVARRLSDAIRPYNEENADALLGIAEGAPRTTYEAMQLLVLYFFLHEYVAKTRVRTLGRLDVLLLPFYRADLESGRYTAEELREMMRFFLFKFWAAKVPYDLPFCIGGLDESGEEVTSEMSELIVDVYDELDIYSPKIHVRVSDKTPERFVKRVLDCIRRGHSSFVFVNDAVAVKALTSVGIEHSDAMNYVPIGCYEPAVWGVEIGCTGNGHVNLPKALELVFTGGRDLKTGISCGTKVGEITTYADFITELKRQISYMSEKSLSYITHIERHYGEINPDPILSVQYEESLRRGIDVFEGGAKYNNSSLYFYCLASLADSVAAVKRLVFDEKRLTLSELSEILKNNWAGAEELRREVLLSPEKFGNNNPTADAIAAEFAEFCASLVNNRPNGRGGVFKAACFTIDKFVSAGKFTMATPDGRRAGEPLSKNFCASSGMDRSGITALIGSVTSFDHALFPNGSVLDVVLHPSAVSGEDGLSAFYALLRTYMKRGGFAMHGNVFDASDLKRAQKTPEKYQNLQVRVCGWNAYFVSLSEAEQNLFISQAENANA